MAQEPWLEKELQKICKDKAHFVESTFNVDMKDKLDLEKLFKENTKNIPTVVLINHNQHYSTILYDPNIKQIIRFNSKFSNYNPLETEIVKKMETSFKCEHIRSLPDQSQKDGWSCAFHVTHFLEGFLSSTDPTPLCEEVLLSKFKSYYEDLLKQLVIPPDSIFYQLIENYSLDQLLNCFTNALPIGVDKSIKNDQKIQIECILIKLWMLQQKDPATFNTFVKKLDQLTPNQRRGLDQVLNEVDWLRQALASLFRESYIKEYQQVISPD